MPSPRCASIRLSMKAPSRLRRRASQPEKSWSTNPTLKSCSEGWESKPGYTKHRERHPRTEPILGPRRLVRCGDGGHSNLAQDDKCRSWFWSNQVARPAALRPHMITTALRPCIRRRTIWRATLWSQPERRPPAANAEVLAAANEFQTHLENALAELPEKLRLVLLLAAMEGHTIEEIAAMLGISTGTVKSRIFYARRQLADKLRCHVNIIKTR